MTITPIGGGVDVPAYVADTAGNKQNAIVVVPVNADGTPTGGSGTSSSQVQGNSASDATDVGNGVKISGLVNTAAPTNATSGQRKDIWVSSRGAVEIAGTSTTGTDAGSNTAIVSVGTPSGNSSTGLLVAGVVFNGSTWDRQRGDTVSMFSRNAPKTKSASAVTAASTTTQQLFAANSLRSRLLIQNQDASINIFINLGAAAVAGAGNMRIAPGASLELTGTSEAVNVIAASGTPAIAAWEF